MGIQRSKSIAEQVKHLLRERIAEGQYGSDYRLPSEERLAQELSVSRATVRTALAGLATEGLVSRRQGEGTYVSKRATEVSMRVGTVWELTRYIIATGRHATIRSLGQGYRLALANEAEALGIQEEDEVVYLDRLFLADDFPLMLSRNVLPVSLLCNDCPAEACEVSILEFIDQFCNRKVGSVNVDIRADCAAESTAGVLGIVAGSPVLRFDEVYCDVNGDPLAYGVSYRHGEPFRLRVLQA